MKRALDFSVALIGLSLLSPLIITVLIAIWCYDFKNPLYRPIRVGKNYQTFRMVKFRSMVFGADKLGPISTSLRDSRITPIGHFIRKFKLDEFPQLWNVLMGDMSLVGPRPQVKSHIDTYYTHEEMKLLSVKPGITDFSSIVFSDLDYILKDSADVNVDYNCLVRPWKSRLGLLYIANQSFYLDVNLIYITIIGIFSKSYALIQINKILLKIKAEAKLVMVCKREDKLVPYPPPGTNVLIITY
jgi:lipopolysaccharide/colanic/teichoic acid biosynthesis glycosyltransferase